MKLDSLKAIASNWLPPAILRMASERLAIGRNLWSGDFGSWPEALARSEGYDATAILERVAAASLEVKRGNAACERDSVLFATPQYSWPPLAGLMWAAARNEGRLDVLDFGGSLGSLYYLNRPFFEGLKQVHWSVVEQERFVREGRARFGDERLHFHETIADCFRERKPDTVILSSVLPYLAEPYALLEEIDKRGFSVVIIDRTSFSREGRDRLTVQRVPADIYPATYPCWFLDEKRLRAVLGRSFDVVAEFDSSDEANLPSYFKGFIFGRR